MKNSIIKKTIFAISVIALIGCKPNNQVETVETDIASNAKTNALIYSENCITEAEIIDAQLAWGEGIVTIGQTFQNQGDYVQAAKNHIQNFYAYDLGSVLFKPTLAAEKQFRPTFDAALSYFVGGNESYPEDKGFAIKPWSKVRWENTGIINNNCKMAVAMGNYYFTPVGGGKEVKVEYTFGYVKDANEQIKISVHQSSVPFQN